MIAHRLLGGVSWLQQSSEKLHTAKGQTSHQEHLPSELREVRHAGMGVAVCISRYVCM